MQINVRSQPTVKLVMNLICFFISTAVLSNELVTDGLISYYTFDQANIDGKKLKDVFGNKPGTIVGAPKPVPGHLGDAMEFGGSPDCIELPQILKIGTNPVTYEAWVKKKNKIGWQYLISNKTDFNDNFFRLGFNKDSGQIRMYTEQENNIKKAFTSDDDYADDKWHHVVATRQADQAKIYVDGFLIKEGIAMEGDIGGDKSNWFLGQNGTNNASEYFIGTLDEVRIYSRALPLKEIQQNFKSEGLAVYSSGKVSLTWATLKISTQTTE
tara:strand:+ start:260 stop:1066 length:807 start_codon:yes stop_codon:yes gene_type:complete